MKPADLFDLIERISKADKLREGHEVLKEALRDFGLDHVAYAAVNIPTQRAERNLIAVTYSPQWQRHYLQQGYVNLDPVVRAGMGGILPVDWANVDRSDPAIRRFFGEAQEFNIGRQGLSIPIRGRHHEFALFTLTSNVSDREWAQIKAQNARDFMMLAYHFHDWALRAEGVGENEYAGRLSTRELECLRWRAIGKSDWETGMIMNISERTVKFHLQCARDKLGASNTMHAVSIAVSLNLITLLNGG